MVRPRTPRVAERGTAADPGCWVSGRPPFGEPPRLDRRDAASLNGHLVPVIAPRPREEEFGLAVVVWIWESDRHTIVDRDRERLSRVRIHEVAVIVLRVVEQREGRPRIVECENRDVQFQDCVGKPMDVRGRQRERHAGAPLFDRASRHPRLSQAAPHPKFRGCIGPGPILGGPEAVTSLTDAHKPWNRHVSIRRRKLGGERRRREVADGRARELHRTGCQHADGDGEYEAARDQHEMLGTRADHLPS